MSTFHAPILEINELEPLDPDLIENYELPKGYLTIEGKKVAHDNSRLKIVTIMVTPGFMVRCVVDDEALEITEGQKVRVIIQGRHIVSIANIEKKKFVFFNAPLRKKYIMPRVMMGVNMAVVSAVAGYILLLIVKHQQSKMGIIIVEGAATLMFLSSIVYAGYYFSNDSEAHTKLRQYLKKLLK